MNYRRTYGYLESWKKLLTPEIVGSLTRLYEYRGKQSLFIEARADALTGLIEIAKIQSTEASNKIEGVFTSDERLKKIVNDKTMPRDRNEKEIAGYRDVLNTIHESYDYIPVKPSILLQLHQMLFKFSGSAYGGKFKAADNVIEERDGMGNIAVRFTPVHAWETSEAIDELCAAYAEALGKGVEPLILIPMFILDFLCIHPFGDGNGRMSRLLTLLLLYRSGYIVGKYISIENLIEQSKQEYYDALQKSSANWHEGKNDYAPFVEYTLNILLAAYAEFTSRVQVIIESKLSKPERVGEIIKNTAGKIGKTEIMQKCPDISQVTVQRALNDLLKEGRIIKIGGGRYTEYAWNYDKE